MDSLIISHYYHYTCNYMKILAVQSALYTQEEQCPTLLLEHTRAAISHFLLYLSDTKYV